MMLCYSQLNFLLLSYTSLFRHYGFELKRRKVFLLSRPRNPTLKAKMTAFYVFFPSLLFIEFFLTHFTYDTVEFLCYLGFSSVF